MFTSMTFPGFTRIFFLLYFASAIAYGQKTVQQKSIYFETAKYELSKESQETLNTIADSLKNLKNFSVTVKGNTDNTGDSAYNAKLSGQRTSAAKNFLVEKGIDPSVISTSAFGETRPVADNGTEEGKHRNRRVDIIVTCTQQLLPDSSKLLPSIFGLYRQTARKPQEFSINPKRDTILRCEKGAIVYVKANAFTITPSSGQRVNLKIKEDFLASDMILDNLSTTSKGRILETQGMLYTEATDSKGKRLNLVRGKDLVIMIPAEKIIPGAKIFQGNRTPHDSIMNWTVNNSSVLSGFSLAELNICSDWLCGGVKECPFFWCKIQRFFRRILGRQERNPITNPPPKAMIPKCEQLEKLYKDYKVSNTADLINMINKPLLDSFQVKTVEELRDTLRKLNLSKVELAYQNKSLSYEDFKFYVYNTPRLGWSNVDVFADIKPDQVTTMKVNLKPATDIDCKLVFKNRRFVIPPTKEDKNYAFENIPADEPVWLIAIQYKNGKPYLSIQEMVTGNNTVNVNFESLTLEELREKLKVLDL